MITQFLDTEKIWVLVSYQSVFVKEMCIVSECCHWIKNHLKHIDILPKNWTQILTIKILRWNTKWYINLGIKKAWQNIFSQMYPNSSSSDASVNWYFHRNSLQYKFLWTYLLHVYLIRQFSSYLNSWNYLSLALCSFNTFTFQFFHKDLKQQVECKNNWLLSFT